MTAYLDYLSINFKIQTKPHILLESSANRNLLLVQQNSELKCERLVIRRRNHRLSVLYKMKNGSAPKYLSNLVPVQTQACYALRNAENIPLPIARSQLYNSSFLPATIRDWNALAALRIPQCQLRPSF